MYPAVVRVLIRFSRAAVLDAGVFMLELLPETLELLLEGLCTQQ